MKKIILLIIMFYFLQYSNIWYWYEQTTNDWKLTYSKNTYDDNSSLIINWNQYNDWIVNWKVWTVDFFNDYNTARYVWRVFVNWSWSYYYVELDLVWNKVSKITDKYKFVHFFNNDWDRRDIYWPEYKSSQYMYEKFNWKKVWVFEWEESTEFDSFGVVYWEFFKLINDNYYTVWILWNKKYLLKNWKVINSSLDSYNFIYNTRESKNWDLCYIGSKDAYNSDDYIIIWDLLIPISSWDIINGDTLDINTIYNRLNDYADLCGRTGIDNNNDPYFIKFNWDLYYIVKIWENKYLYKNTDRLYNVSYSNGATYWEWYITFHNTNTEKDHLYKMWNEVTEHIYNKLYRIVKSDSFEWFEYRAEENWNTTFWKTVNLIIKVKKEIILEPITKIDRLLNKIFYKIDKKWDTQAKLIYKNLISKID